jgi:hypothetical protein
LFSGIGVTAVAKLDQDIQTFRGGHRRVIVRAGCFGVLKAGECPRLFPHDLNRS